MNSDFLWQTLSGAAAFLTAALTLARLWLDYGLHGGERRLERLEHTEQPRRARQRDAEARLERILQDRLAEADRRLDRSDAELRAERDRAANLERELLVRALSCSRRRRGPPSGRSRGSRT